MFLLFVSLAHATCVTPTTQMDLLDDILEAEDAWKVMDRSRLDARMEAADRHLPCLVDPVSRDLAASYHRMKALRAWTVTDSEIRAPRSPPVTPLWLRRQ